MEKIQIVLANPWIILFPLLAPMETLLLLFFVVYAFVVYLPYKIVQLLYREIGGKGKAKEIDTQRTEPQVLAKIPDVLEKMSCLGCGGSVLDGRTCTYCGSTYIKSTEHSTSSERQNA